jgi:tetratricopeptide (TPR) repeat protein
MTRYYYQHCKYDEAITIIQQTIDVWKISSDQSQWLLAEQYEGWAEVAMCIHQPEVALQMSLRGLEMRKKMLKEDGVITNQLATTHTIVARALIMQDKIDEAETFIRESIRLRKATPDFSKLHLFTPLIWQALIYYRRENYESALECLEQALRDRWQLYGKNDKVGKRSVYTNKCG